MSWIQTFTGKKFDPFRPRVEDVNLVDIAHALAHQCRFGGHCKRFYSVAEHSIHVSDLLATPGQYDLAREGLMHDATEAYFIDIPSPIKRNLLGIKEIEDELSRVISERFKLLWPSMTVSRVDRLMLEAERRAMFDPYIPWESTASVQDEYPKNVPFRHWAPWEAKAHFLRRAEALGIS